MGADLALVGLSFQVFTILLFCCFFADYLIHYSHSGQWHDQMADRAGTATRLKLFSGFMVLAILLTLARCSYRVTRYIGCL